MDPVLLFPTEKDIKSGLNVSLHIVFEFRMFFWSVVLPDQAHPTFTILPHFDHFIPLAVIDHEVDVLVLPFQLQCHSLVLEGADLVSDVVVSVVVVVIFGPDEHERAGVDVVRLADEPGA